LLGDARYLVPGRRPPSPTRRCYRVKVVFLVPLVPILDVELGLYATRWTIPNAAKPVIRIARRSVRSRIRLVVLVARSAAKAIGIALPAGWGNVVIEARSAS
jgi:hypothetical protein